MSRKSSDEAEAVVAIMGCLGVLALYPALTALSGYIFLTMWDWFAVPIGAPQLGLAHATGLLLLIKYVTWSHIETEGKGFVRLLAEVTGRVGGSLLLAWGCSRLM